MATAALVKRERPRQRATSQRERIIGIMEWWSIGVLE
jgi:hypothetical protein